MDDSDTSSSWLSEDRRLFIYAIISLAIVVGGHRTWQEYYKYHENATRRARVLRLVENSRREKERTEAKLSATTPHTQSIKQHVAEAVASSSDVPSTAEQIVSGDAAASSSSRAPNSKRSKERRKRGRDVLKEVVKQERRASKMSKQRPQSSQPHAGPSDRGASTSTSRPRGASHTRSSSRASSKIQMSDDYDDSGDDTPQPSGSAVHLNASTSTATEHAVDRTVSHLTPRAKAHSENENVCESPTALAARIPLPVSPAPRSLLDGPSSCLGHSSQTPLSPATTSTMPEHEPTNTNSFIFPQPKESTTQSFVDEVAQHTLPGPSSSVHHENDPPPLSPTSSHIPISQPTPYAPPMQKHPSWLGNGLPQQMQPHMKSHHFKSLSTSSASSFVMSEAGWENDNHAQYAHTHTNGHRRGKSPPPRFRSKSRASASPTASLSSIPGLPTSSAQIASYKGALEAARLREDSCQKELKRCREERDMWKSRHKEESYQWRQKQAEMQMQIQYLMQQLHTMSLVSSPQTQFQYQQQQLHSPRILGGFSVMQQAPYTVPSTYPNQHPHMSGTNGNPAMYPQYPYPSPFPGGSAPHMSSRSGSQSSSTASPALEFTPPTYFQGVHHGANGLNGVNGMNGINGMTKTGSSAGSGSGGGDDDFSDELAEAILKRPESIRSPTSTSASGSGSGGSRSASVTGRATRDGGFTFPSLSELGNPQRGHENRDQKKTEWDGSEEVGWEKGGDDGGEDKVYDDEEQKLRTTHCDRLEDGTSAIPGSMEEANEAIMKTSVSEGSTLHVRRADVSVYDGD